MPLVYAQPTAVRVSWFFKFREIRLFFTFYGETPAMRAAILDTTTNGPLAFYPAVHTPLTRQSFRVFRIFFCNHLKIRLKYAQGALISFKRLIVGRNALLRYCRSLVRARRRQAGISPYFWNLFMIKRIRSICRRFRRFAFSMRLRSALCMSRRIPPSLTKKFIPADIRFVQLRFFKAHATALISLSRRRKRITKHIRAGRLRAIRLLRLAKESHRHISTVEIGARGVFFRFLRHMDPYLTQIALSHSFSTLTARLLFAVLCKKRVFRLLCFPSSGLQQALKSAKRDLKTIRRRVIMPNRAFRRARTLRLKKKTLVTAVIWRKRCPTFFFWRRGHNVRRKRYLLARQRRRRSRKTEQVRRIQQYCRPFREGWGFKFRRRGALLALRSPAVRRFFFMRLHRRRPSAVLAPTGRIRSSSRFLDIVELSAANCTTLSQQRLLSTDVAPLVFRTQRGPKETPLLSIPHRFLPKALSTGLVRALRLTLRKQSRRFIGRQLRHSGFFCNNAYWAHYIKEVSAVCALDVNILCLHRKAKTIGCYRSMYTRKVTRVRLTRLPLYGCVKPLIKLFSPKTIRLLFHRLLRLLGFFFVFFKRNKRHLASRNAVGLLVAFLFQKRYRAYPLFINLQTPRVIFRTVRIVSTRLRRLEVKSRVSSLTLILREMRTRGFMWR